ncbi:hypothetical protein JCM10212_005907 [Sporobolomyces blumeae]
MKHTDHDDSDSDDGLFALPLPTELSKTRGGDSEPESDDSDDDLFADALALSLAAHEDRRHGRHPWNPFEIPGQLVVTKETSTRHVRKDSNQILGRHPNRTPTDPEVGPDRVDWAATPQRSLSKYHERFGSGRRSAIYGFDVDARRSM